MRGVPHGRGLLLLTRPRVAPFLPLRTATSHLPICLLPTPYVPLRASSRTNEMMRGSCQSTGPISFSATLPS